MSLVYDHSHCTGQEIGNSHFIPTQSRQRSFPAFFSANFDYSEFMRFDAAMPPENGLYQSNGFLALVENGFGAQTVNIPAATGNTPDTHSDLVSAIEITAPVLVDRNGHIFDFAKSPANRHVTYYADRTVYSAAFTEGPTASLTVYPVYGQPAAVFRVSVKKSDGAITISLGVKPLAFLHKRRPGRKADLSYAVPHLPYRVLVAAKNAAAASDSFQARIKEGQSISIVLASEASEEKAAATLRQVKASADLLERSTHQAWNDYLASVPLVAPAGPLQSTIANTGEKHTISPEDLVRSELWQWRGLLSDTLQVRYMPASPLTIADWQVFMGMWNNDGIAEAIALASTNRKDLARASILHWFRYAVNDLGDGHSCWTLFPSGRTTRQGKGPERDTEGVPLPAVLVGEYVRLTGDISILDEKPGGYAGNRTLWQDVVAYQRNLLAVRDVNHDSLVDWTHKWETGWDDKDSPFVDLKPYGKSLQSAMPCGFSHCRRYGVPTTAMNEQVFLLASLQEMAYLARLRGEDTSEWEKQFDTVRNTVRTKLWDKASRRYWDMNVETGALWTKGENLDAYYFLYYEPDPNRIAAMMKRLNDPAKFNGALLPTLAFDTPDWGGYWRGPSWPREYSHFALALSHAGQGREAFLWLARGINTNLGPLLPETIDSRTYPHQYKVSGVRIMGYDALDSAVMPDIAGLRTWGGEDLTVQADPSLGKLFVRGVKWKGDSYDAIFVPNKPSRIWRNGHELPPLEADLTWTAVKEGSSVSFEPMSSRANLHLSE